MKHRDSGALPPCVLSAQCQRLLDDLDSPAHPLEQVFSTTKNDLRDELLVEKLRRHLPTCPTCAAALAQARQVRSQQRMALRRYLAESESRVPSTTERIFAALRDEERSLFLLERSERKRLDSMLPEVLLPLTPPTPSELNGNHRHTTDPLTLSPLRRWLHNGLTLAAVAALLFAAVGIFGHFISRSSGNLAGLQTQVARENHNPATKVPGSPTTHPLPTPEPASPGSTATTDNFQGWDGVVLISGIGVMYNVISTYNYLNGDRRVLAQSPATMQFDGVGSFGQNMLYQVALSGHTLYYTLQQLPTTGFFYELDEDNALNAIWMPDNVHVLIATANDGVIEVDTQNGQAQPFLPSLKTSGLKFYRGDYLYFLGGADDTANTLFRVNVKSGAVQRVSGRSTDGDFWLSPDGYTVFYKNAGPVGAPGIYAVNNDGTSGGVLRQDGQLIGYAPDDSPVMIRQVGQSFEVVQLGAPPEQDRVLLRDVAPGASSLCDPSVAAETICDTTNIALAPLSHALVVIASYPDGSRKVWSDDLTTGKQSVIMTPTSDTAVMVPGWDRIAVA